MPVKDQPAGTILVRLADVPLEQRLNALSAALRLAKTPGEAMRLLGLAVNPGDAGGRVAA